MKKPLTNRFGLLLVVLALLLALGAMLTPTLAYFIRTSGKWKNDYTPADPSDPSFDATFDPSNSVSIQLTATENTLRGVTLYVQNQGHPVYVRAAIIVSWLKPADCDCIILMPCSEDCECEKCMQCACGEDCECEGCDCKEGEECTCGKDCPTCEYCSESTECGCAECQYCGETIYCGDIREDENGKPYIAKCEHCKEATEDGESEGDDNQGGSSDTDSTEPKEDDDGDEDKIDVRYFSCRKSECPRHNDDPSDDWDIVFQLPVKGEKASEEKEATGDYVLETGAGWVQNGNESSTTETDPFYYYSRDLNMQDDKDKEYPDYLKVQVPLIKEFTLLESAVPPNEDYDCVLNIEIIVQTIQAIGYTDPDPTGSETPAWKDAWGGLVYTDWQKIN